MQDLQAFLTRVAAGGFTYNPRLDCFIDPGSMVGYLVGIKPFGREYFIDTQSWRVGALIIDFYTEHSPLLDGNLLRFIGGWVENGVLHLDVVEYVYELDRALMVGALNEQIAIFDIAAGESIYLREVA